MEESKKPNWFVRVLLSLFCILLTAMVLYRYLTIDPRGEIGAGVITLLCLLLILVLAESFDNFAVGQVISISREVRKKEKDVEKLEKRNEALFSQLIAVANSQSQQQNHTNVYGDYHGVPTIQKASEAEVQEKLSSDLSSADQTLTPPRVRVNWQKAEQLGMKKYLALRNLSPANVILEAKLVTQFYGIDPISNMQPVFDGYIKEAEQETFVEVRPRSLLGPSFRDRLYLTLSKINYYRSVKRIDAHLDLVLVRVVDDETRTVSFDRMVEHFQPAIASGLLKMHEIELTADEGIACSDIGA